MFIIGENCVEEGSIENLTLRYLHYLGFEWQGLTADNIGNLEEGDFKNKTVMVILTRMLLLGCDALYMLEVIRKAIRKAGCHVITVYNQSCLNKIPEWASWLMGESCLKLNRTDEAYKNSLQIASLIVDNSLSKEDGIKNSRRIDKDYVEGQKDAFIKLILEHYIYFKEMDSYKTAQLLYSAIAYARLAGRNYNKRNIEGSDNNVIKNISEYILKNSGIYCNAFDIENELLEKCFLLAIKSAYIYN